MNDNQKDKLLKIAENNPELAKDLVDILKQEPASSNEPMAVRVVKDEADKIVITSEQKKYVKYLIRTYVVGGIIAILGMVQIQYTTNS